MSLIEKAMKSVSEREARKNPAAGAPPEAENVQPQAAAAASPESPPAPAAAAQPRHQGVVAFRRIVEQQAGVDRRHFAALQSELKHLKRALIKAAFGPLSQPDAPLVNISSAMPGAGKTFLTMQLGLSLAQERDRRVLLVDADNARGSLTRALGLKGQPGFYDLLHDPSLSADELLCETDCPSLRLLPGGRNYEDSVELINSERARTVMRGLIAADPGLLVLIDGPPLLVSPDAAALTGLAGQVLMIVEAGQTTENDVEQALQLVDDDKPVGLVLNKIPNSRLLDYRSGYYYYYGSEPGREPTPAQSGHG